MEQIMDKEYVLNRVEQEGIKFIRLWFTDVLGTLKNFAIPKEELENALDEGMGFDGSSIIGYQTIEESDMIAKPDPRYFCHITVETQRKGGRQIDMRHT